MEASAGATISPPPQRPAHAAGGSARSAGASRLFGYDIFVSFALGMPPRGSQAYASDLTRQLRERDLAVFFSEDQALPGDPLTPTLRRALARSRMLVVLLTAGTLRDRFASGLYWSLCAAEISRELNPAASIACGRLLGQEKSGEYGRCSAR